MMDILYIPSCKEHIHLENFLQLFKLWILRNQSQILYIFSHITQVSILYLYVLIVCNSKGQFHN